MSQYEIISQMDSGSLNEYLAKCPAITVFEAYGSAFGTPQVLAYEWNALDYICRCFLEAGENERRKFCNALEGELSAPSDVIARQAEKEVRRREGKLTMLCRLSSLCNRLAGN